LAVTEAATFTALVTFSNDIFLDGSSQRLVYEGSTANAYETFVAATDPTADRTITFPDATGTVSLQGDGNANDILSNSVFN
jgi:hypothetical protein